MILDEIVANKRRELSEKKPNSFRDLFRSGDIKIICELKRKSPTKPDGFKLNDQEVFSDYKQIADAISVVTDKKYFNGTLDMVTEAQKTNLPVIRKDFVIDTNQVGEVKTDALLLIVKIVEPDYLKTLVDTCLAVGIEPVVEINDEADLSAAIATRTNIIAVNTRNLNTQEIDSQAGNLLLEQVPDRFIRLLFSGVSSYEDVENAKRAGANGVLVGTSILESDDRIAFINGLRGGND